MIVIIYRMFQAVVFKEETLFGGAYFVACDQEGQKTTFKEFEGAGKRMKTMQLMNTAKAVVDITG